MRLETSLASSTAREDHLREELAAGARREGATQEKHTRAIAEVRQGKMKETMVARSHWQSDHRPLDTTERVRTKNTDALSTMTKTNGAVRQTI